MLLTDSFNSKAKITGQNDDEGEIDNVEITVPLKYLSNFWRTPEIPLIKCEPFISFLKKQKKLFQIFHKEL